MHTVASDSQKRAIKFLSRKFPDTVLPLLAERGGVVENLSFKQAHEIMEVVGEKHPKGGQKRDDFKQRQQDDQREQERRRLEQQEQREQEFERLKREQQEQEELREQEREQQEQDEHDQLQQDDDNQQKEQKEDDLKDQRKFAPRKGSKQEYMANKLREHNLDVEATRAALADQIGQIPQLTFTENVDGARRPLPMGTLADDSQQQTQHGRALKTLFAVRRQLLLGGDGKREQKFEHQQRQQDKREDKEHKKDERDNRSFVEYLAWCRQMRQYCKDKAADNQPLDKIGLRPVESGAAMLKQGISLAAVKHAMTLHFPPEARRALGVRDYDVTTHKPNERKDGIHAALPYCLDIVNARDHDGMRLLLTLIGDKGTGKTTLAKQIAKELQLPFGFVSMTSGTSPSAFNGRPMIADDGTQALIAALTNLSQIESDDGKALTYAKQALMLAKQRHAKGDTVMSQFVKLYGGGGVFLFDELDAADENLLLGLNAPLANGYFANPATGQKIEQHPDFIAIAGMNTMGLGATRDHGARNRLDSATLDRWNPGRVIIELDSRIEESMFWAIVNR